MGLQANPYPLRVEKNIMNKFKVIAKENGRSVNKEIEILLKNAIWARNETSSEKVNSIS